MTDKTKEAETTKDGAVQSEGDYESARVYKRDVESFLQKKDADIPKMARDAEQAVDGPEGPHIEKAQGTRKTQAPD